MISRRKQTRTTCTTDFKKQLILAILLPIILLLGAVVHELGHALAIISTGGTFYRIAIEGRLQPVCYGTFNPASATFVYFSGGLFQMCYFLVLGGITTENSLFLGALSSILYGVNETFVLGTLYALSQILLGLMVCVVFAKLCLEFNRWLK